MSCARSAPRHPAPPRSTLHHPAHRQRRPRPAAISVFKTLLLVDSAHYPETLGCCLLINVPFVFKAVWALFRPLAPWWPRAPHPMHGSAARVGPRTAAVP